MAIILSNTAARASRLIQSSVKAMTLIEVKMTFYIQKSRWTFG